MPEALRFERAGNRLRVQKWRTPEGGDATLLASCDVRGDPAKRTDREVRIGAEELSAGGCVGVSKEQLWTYILAFEGGGPAYLLIYPGGVAPEKPFRVRSRTSTECVRYDTFDEALTAAVGADHVIEWDDRSLACCVDLDFHGAGGDSAALAMAARALRPAPWRWWITRSYGLRCVFLRTERQEGLSLAGVAAMELLEAFPTAGMELISRTRRPPEGTETGGTWESGVQDDGADAVRRLQGQYTAEDLEYSNWLEERGWEVGGRYPHTECPASPSPRAGGNTNPVVVHDDHVHCYICAADGVCHGGHTPGHFPAARLCGGYHKSLFALCVERLTHWEHARHVLESVPSLAGRGEIARAVYRAALARHHGGSDPRVHAVFAAGANLIRYDGHWGDDQGRPIVIREERPQRIYELPAVLRRTEDGDTVPCQKTAEWLRHPGDISRYGYPAVVPIWGLHLTSGIEPEGWKVFTVLNTQALRSEAMRDRRPRYVPVRSRMPEAEAWAELEKPFPGINRRFVELLIACKGLAEVGSGMPPMMFVSGPTGAGKSATVKIAAAMLGDHSTEVPYSSNTERLRAGLMSAKKKGTYACFDEFLKGVGRERKDPAQGMESLLNFTPDSESHMLYVGPVPLGSLPVCVWCDTAIPKEVVEHAQLARRLAWVKLPSRMRWEQSLAACSLPGPEAVRTHGSRRLIDACDALLSWVADRTFETVPLFSALVRGLGFVMLEDVDIAREKEAVVRAFFQAVCATPEYVGSRAPGKGWQELDRNTEGVVLADLWKILADPTGVSSRALEETDLAAVCGLSQPARVEVRTYAQFVYIRFSADDGSECYNGGLNAVELQTGGSGVHGSRDAVGGLPAFSGWPGLPASLEHASALWSVPPAADAGDGGVGS